MTISKINIGNIAERIVSNELEALGFRVTNLNKDGLSTNADLIAARDGKIWQIQVKGATNKEKEHWWVQYGHCNDEIIAKKMTMFNNKKTSFYVAEIVVLVAVKSPNNYCCVVMPTRIAEKAAQINIERYYRTPKKDGGTKKPGKVWLSIEKNPRARVNQDIYNDERRILEKYKDAWNVLDTVVV